MSVLAIIPARSGSQGIPQKNWKPLCGMTPVKRAVECARAVRAIETIVVSTDAGPLQPSDTGALRVTILHRPPELATDTAGMIDVVRHVLEQIPAPPDQRIVLLQPTQPLRKPEHITQALELLTPEVDSVVSVVEIPQTHAAMNHGYISTEGDGLLMQAWSTFTPARRQDCGRSFIRDGTCYAFHRRTVTKHNNIYGELVKPLIIDPADTCPLDTPQDWLEAERRLRERTPQA